MKDTDIAKIRQSTEIAKEIIEKAIEWAKNPQSVDLYCNNALDSLDRILTLLPCPTCNGTRRKIMFQPGQREFGGDASTSYEIPCPDCT